jgi:hypothetical protein
MMLVYTPNTIPKSLLEKFCVYVPSIKFTSVPKDFQLYEDVPSVDLTSTPPGVIYTRHFTGKNFLQIDYCVKKNTRTRYTSGYSGDYDEDCFTDGIRVLFYLGHISQMIDVSAYVAYEQISLSEKPRYMFGKDRAIRDDLDHPQVQRFVLDLLEEHWHTLLQATLF